MARLAPLLHPIPRRQGRCCRCNVPFSGGAPYCTLLSHPLAPAGGVRHDFCAACGADVAGSREPGTIFWQGKVPLKAAEEQPPPPLVAAVVLLRDLCTADDEAAAGQAFLLALYLVRRRLLVLRHEEVAADGQELLWYEVLDAAELVAVPRASPREVAAAELYRQLTERAS